jgi:hypothetical protein
MGSILLGVGWWQFEGLANRIPPCLFFKKQIDGSLKKLFI